MHSTRFRSVARWLLPVLLGLLLLWLALPRLLGLAAEHWLDTPGLEALHIDIDEVGGEQMHLHEVRAVYLSAGGHRFQFVLRDIELRYSLASRTMERLDISSGELDIFPGKEAQHSPWPQIEMPSLPLSEVQVGHLRVAVYWPEKLPLEAVGNFRLREMAGQWQGEFRPGTNLLRVAASQPRHPGRELEIHAEWLSGDGLAADVRLHIGGQPQQQPARLVARLPLPMLTELNRWLGFGMPLTATRGTAMLTAEALLGEAAGTLRGISGDAEFVDGGMRIRGAGTGTESPIEIEVDGKLGFTWEPLHARIEFLSGLRWQLMDDGEERWRASGRLERAFAVRMDDGVATSVSHFPFVLHLPQWGQWEGEVERVKASGDPGLGDWRSAEVRLHLRGHLKQWQRDASQMHGLQAAGTVMLNWSRSAGLFSELALRLNIQRLAWLAESPLTVGKSTWEVKANAEAKIGGDFWNSLDVKGEASSPQLKVTLGGAQTLTLGPSRLRLAHFRPAGPKGAQGELLLSADAIKMISWPAPDVRAHLRLDDGALRADGTIQLQGTEVLRFAGMHALARGCVEARMTTQQALQTLGELLQPRPPALRPLDIQKGEADARFNVDWCTRPRLRLNAKGTLHVRDAAVGWQQARADMVQLGLQFDGLNPLQGRIQFAAQRGELATGTPLADLNVDLALGGQTLNVRTLHVKLLGGSVSSAPLSLPWPLGEKALPLEIHQIDLGQLLALAKVQGLSGSGQLGGVLPLVYRDGSVEIRHGQLDSLGAGTIKYAPGESLPDNPGLLALRNFHFQRLGAQVWYSADGTYRTQATLEGNNPDFYSGYPIRFGLNINGKLPGLFRSAVFSGDFNRHILEQLQSGKLE
jgi:hypothetical protein